MIEVSQNSPYIGYFYIDSSIGKDTKIQLSGSDLSTITISVESDRNESYSSQNGQRLTLPEIISVRISFSMHVFTALIFVEH